jgi:hypothetical protein
MTHNPSGTACNPFGCGPGVFQRGFACTCSIWMVIADSFHE